MRYAWKVVLSLAAVDCPEDKPRRSPEKMKVSFFATFSPQGFICPCLRDLLRF
jgi:hypothetical protein